MEDIKVKKFFAFRGDTEFIYNPSPIGLSESDYKKWKKLCLESTATQFQRKYQDSMKGLAVKRKTQKSVSFEIEVDKVIEAQVQQRQELKSNQITGQYRAPDQQCLVWQECDGGAKEGLRNPSLRH